MDNSCHTSFRADDRSFFSLIKKDVHKIVLEAGFSQAKVSEIDIIVAELTSNLSKHASGGELLLHIGKKYDKKFVELICLDDGPGISDLGKVLLDGYSSTSTLGHGLGSIKRLSDEFDIYSLKDWGTIVLSRLYEEELPYRRKQYDFNIINVPKSGEKLSGDGYYFTPLKNGFKILLADGLGHGPEAHKAVKEACIAFNLCTEEGPADTIRFLHNSIRKTRGMVATVVFYNTHQQQWTVAGVGNVALKWMNWNNNKNHVSYNGIIGHNIPNTLNEAVVSKEEFSQFIACSDGIRSKWDLSKFPSILRYDGTIIAAAIYKEFSRKTDDTSVMFCKLF